MTILSNIVWIDPSLNNSKYLKELESLRFFNIKLYKTIEESIYQIKKN